MKGLELDSVTKTFESFELGPVDLSVDDEVLAILGPSGCGKTTLLSLIAGVVRPDGGQVFLNGVDITDHPIDARGTVVMFQDGALFPHLTARENVEYAATSESQVHRIVDLLDIRDVLEQYPRSLSGGEKQRVALARSLTANPDALLLDEPLSSLDAPIRRRLRTEMRDVFELLSIPVVYVTHDRHEATVVADELAVIEDGQMRQYGSPKEVLRRPQNEFVAEFTGGGNLIEARVVERGARVVLEWGTRRVVSIDSDVDVEIGETVSVTIRPEYVELDRRGSGRENAFSGTLTTVTFEGNAYRVTVRLDGDRNQSAVECVVPPLSFEQTALEYGEAVTITFPPEAVHVIG